MSADCSSTFLPRASHCVLDTPRHSTFGTRQSINIHVALDHIRDWLDRHPYVSMARRKGKQGSSACCIDYCFRCVGICARRCLRNTGLVSALYRISSTGSLHFLRAVHRSRLVQYERGVTRQPSVSLKGHACLGLSSANFRGNRYGEVRVLVLLGSSLSSSAARRRLRIRQEALVDGVADAPLEASQRLLAGLALL
jgi:hypothetical protein